MHIFCHFFAEKFGSLKYNCFFKFTHAFLIIIMYILYTADFLQKNAFLRRILA